MLIADRAKKGLNGLNMVRGLKHGFHHRLLPILGFSHSYFSVRRSYARTIVCCHDREGVEEQNRGRLNCNWSWNSGVSADVFDLLCA